MVTMVTAWEDALSPDCHVRSDHYVDVWVTLILYFYSLFIVTQDDGLAAWYTCKHREY